MMHILTLLYFSGLATILMLGVKSPYLNLVAGTDCDLSAVVGGPHPGLTDLIAIFRDQCHERVHHFVVHYCGRHRDWSAPNPTSFTPKTFALR